MGHEIDIKALASHIIRGDGSDRCRICMGPVDEGAVFLEDTITLDGERPITLIELLNTLTGIQVGTAYCFYEIRTGQLLILILIDPRRAFGADKFI